MKLLINALTILTFSILLPSCGKDFLTTPSRQILPRQSYVTDLATSTEYMRGIYYTFAAYACHGLAWTYIDLASDNLATTASYNTLKPHYQWVQSADAYNGSLTSSSLQNLNPLWVNSYQIIHRCGFLLETVDKYNSENPKEVLHIKAQALAMRALTHFLLLNIFAQPYDYTPEGSHPGVPYMLTSRTDEPAVRKTVKECYDLVLQDLHTALQMFPTESSNQQYLNINATKALIARVNLFKSDYIKAKEMANEVIQKKPLMPAGPDGYPSKLFTLKETEALFQLTPASSGTGEVISTLFSSYYFRFGNFLCSPSLSGILSENPDDLRNSWIRKGADGKDTVTKFPMNIVSGNNSPFASYYLTILRSTEMYLTCAESYARLGSSKVDSARYFLDAIRFRANANALPTSATGQALLDSIYKERRKEMCFEGLRLFDLQRWKLPIDRPNESNPAAKTLAYPNNKRIAPIPSPDVQLAGVKQNDGY